jgi:hypothetical protein
VVRPLGRVQELPRRATRRLRRPRPIEAHARQVGRVLRRRAGDGGHPDRILSERCRIFRALVRNLISFVVDPLTLTIGQLAWMDFDLHLTGMKPLLLTSEIPSWKVDVLIQDAQRDLYQPIVHPSSRVYIVHARKRK